MKDGRISPRRSFPRANDTFGWAPDPARPPGKSDGGDRRAVAPTRDPRACGPEVDDPSRGRFLLGAGDPGGDQGHPSLPGREEVELVRGLAPRVAQSGNSLRTGHIHKQGPKAMRWIMTSCAHAAVKAPEGSSGSYGSGLSCWGRPSSRRRTGCSR